MRPVDKDRESSIDLRFPHLTPLFSPWRDAHAARGIPPYVSLLYPWRTPPVGDRDIDAVRAAIANCEAFPITFSAIARFPRERVLYLKIQDNAPLRKLVDAIHGAFPETPPYRGEHREVIPHLTILTACADFQLDRLEPEIRLRLEPHLPLSVEAQSVIVAQENLDGIWSNVAKLPLILHQFTANLDTEVGALIVTHARAADFDPVMAILREAADWLAARGNPQWHHWHMDFGENILRQRLEHDEVYLFRREKVPVGTLTIQWSDPDVWGEPGNDGLAGYIHGMGISRTLGGKRVGESMLEWAVDRIAHCGRRFARLDAQASNVSLCRYYEDRGFGPRGTKLLAGDFLTRLFEKKIILV